MRKKIKNNLRKAFEAETPNLKEKIISSCERETQLPMQTKANTFVKNKILSFKTVIICLLCCLFTFSIGMQTGIFLLDSSVSEKVATYVYMDVNPSIEFSLDENNVVINCVATNDDGKNILQDMSLKGVEMQTAIKTIVGAMYIKGYLGEDENSMLISVETNGENDTENFLSYVTQQVNEVFKGTGMECAIIAQSVHADDELKQRAEDYGVSVGKMLLVDKVIDGYQGFSLVGEDSLVNMSIKELNHIYSSKPNRGEKPDAKDEVISGNVGGYVHKEDALNYVLIYLEKTNNDVDYHEMFVLPDRKDNDGIIYLVKIKINGEDVRYFDVDCVTGDVIELDNNDKGNSNKPTYGEGQHIHDDKTPNIDFEVVFK